PSTSIEYVLNKRISGQWATISTDGTTLVVSAAISTTTIDDFYSTDLGGHWNSSLISSSESHVQQGTATQGIFNYKLGVVWAISSSSQYNVKFALVTLSPQTTSTSTSTTTSTTQSSSCSSPASNTKNGATITINSNCAVVGDTITGTVTGLQPNYPYRVYDMNSQGAITETIKIESDSSGSLSFSLPVLSSMLINGAQTENRIHVAENQSPWSEACAINFYASPTSTTTSGVAAFTNSFSSASETFALSCLIMLVTIASFCHSNFMIPKKDLIVSTIARDRFPYFSS
ncbi:MAG: hypothetical protein ACREAN_03900, partial [Nitrosopumilaceae archaeon]